MDLLPPKVTAQKLNSAWLNSTEQEVLDLELTNFWCDISAGWQTYNKLIQFVIWQIHLMATGPELSLWLAEGRLGRYQFIAKLHPCFPLLLLGQPKLFLWKDEKEGCGGAKAVSISNTRHEIHSRLYLLSGVFASNHVLMHLPCFHSWHVPFCKHLLASGKSKLRAGICKCTECGSCSTPTGINGISTSSANGGRQPRIIPLRHELVWITYPARTLGGQRSFGKAALWTSLSKLA